MRPLSLWCFFLLVGIPAVVSQGTRFCNRLALCPPGQVCVHAGGKGDGKHGKGKGGKGGTSPVDPGAAGGSADASACRPDDCQNVVCADAAPCSERSLCAANKLCVFDISDKKGHKLTCQSGGMCIVNATGALSMSYTGSSVGWSQGCARPLPQDMAPSRIHRTDALLAPAFARNGIGFAASLGWSAVGAQDGRRLGLAVVGSLHRRLLVPGYDCGL